MYVPYSFQLCHDRAMARFARAVAPGVPHHVTQRGNRREPIFCEDGDRAIYCAILAGETRKAGVEVWAYCLMPNHVHLILTPSDQTGLGRAMGEAHRRYTGFINARAGWTGRLFQGRYASVVMDEPTSSPPPATSASIRCAPGWRSGRRTGSGLACARI